MRLSTGKQQPRAAGLFADLTALFLAEGFLHLTTDEIARRLRCSKTTLYALGPSREALRGTVVQRYLDRVRADGVAAATQAADWTSALIGLLGAGAAAAREASWEFVRDIRLHPASQRLLLRHQRQRVTDLERLLEAGMRQGAFRGLHPRLVAELLLTMIGKVFEPQLLTDVGLSLGEAYDEAYRMVEFGLIPRQPALGSVAGSAPRRRREAGKAKPGPALRRVLQPVKL
ncbi:MAG: TetR/AcrR family transcriptional regulator [Deltaproteobacteria bacterium]|nr:TetR/AcrR family transcriptional regulator [Deltaproteobacteria bacterium]